MRNSPSCGCCFCTRCRIALEDFNEANTTTLNGLDWSEEAGDWEILSNELSTTSTDAVLYYLTTHAYGYASNVITVSAKGADAGDQLDVLSGIDANDYWIRVRLTIVDGATCGTLAIDEVEGAAEDNIALTQVPDATEDAWHTIKVCHFWDSAVYSFRVIAEVTTASGKVVRVSALTAIGGDRIGLGTGAITTRAYFDNLCWQRHYSNEVISGHGPDTGCPRCGTNCLYSSGYIDAVGTDLGCAWEECTGSWSIEDSGGGVLAITTTSAPAELVHEIGQPYQQPQMRISLYVKFEDAGDIVQVIGASGICSTSAGAGVELECHATCGTIRVIDGGVQVGADVDITGLVPDVWHHVEVCIGKALVSNSYGATHLTISVTPNGLGTTRVSEDVSNATSNLAKIVTSVVGTKVWFKGWQQSVTYIEDLAEHCDTCNDDDWCVWHIYDCASSDACEWTTVAGSWTCLATSSDDATKTYQGYQPHRSNRMRMLGTVTMSGSGTAIAYIAYKDATEYMALRITTGGTCPTVELVEDGVVLRSVEDHRIVADAAIDFCVMFDGAELSAWYLLPGLGFEHIYLESPATGHASGGLVTGLKTAVGTGTVTTGSVTFTDVSLYVAKSATNTACEDCDKCYVWFAAETLADGPAFNGTAGASLSCEYNGTAVYGTVNDQALGTSVEAAIVPAGGSMTFDVGTDDGETVAYVSFYLTARPAVLTVTSCGVAAVLTVASNGTATLAVAGGTATSISVVAIETQYTLKLCSFGADSRALLLDGDWQVSGASFGSAIGSGTVNGSTVTIAAATNDIAVRSVGVTRHLKNDGETSCGECEPFCDVCQNNQMPSQILVEFEGCSGVFLPDLGCCSLNGAWFVTMGDCGGVLEWSDAQGDKRIEVELTDHTTYVAVRVYWAHYESGFGGALIGSGEWGADLPKPVDCLHFSRQELAIDAGVVSASDPACETALTGTQCFVSAT